MGKIKPRGPRFQIYWSSLIKTPPSHFKSAFTALSPENEEPCFAAGALRERSPSTGLNDNYKPKN